MKDLIARLRYPTPALSNHAKIAADALEAQVELVKKWQGLCEAAQLVAESAQKRAEAQAKEIEVLRADKDRLDCLEANPRHAQIMVDGVVTDCVFYGISCAQLVKLREAIDALRRK